MTLWCRNNAQRLNAPRLSFTFKTGAASNGSELSEQSDQGLQSSLFFMSFQNSEERTSAYLSHAQAARVHGRQKFWS